MATIRRDDIVTKRIVRIVLPGVIAVLAMVTLAACGGQADGSAQPTTAQATATVAATSTPQVLEPEATPTQVADTMESMDGMADETPTPVSIGAPPTPTAAPATQEENSDATTIAATLREWAIDLSQSEVSAGKITFTVTNAGRMTHNLTVLDNSGASIGATVNFGPSDGPQTFEIELQPGTYTVVCSLPGHAARGQQTELIVK